MNEIEPTKPIEVERLDKLLEFGMRRSSEFIKDCVVWGQRLDHASEFGEQGIYDQVYDIAYQTLERKYIFEKPDKIWRRVE